MVLFGVAHLRLKRDGFKGSFWVVFMVLWVSSAAIMVSPSCTRVLPPARTVLIPGLNLSHVYQVRCIYRVVELAQGFEGTLYTHEGE